MPLINCKEIYDKKIVELKDKFDTLSVKKDFYCFLIKDEKTNQYDSASEIYIKYKKETSKEVGINLIEKKMNSKEFHDFLSNLNKPILAILQLPASNKDIQIFEQKKKEGLIFDPDFMQEEVYLNIVKGDISKIPPTPRAVLEILNLHFNSIESKKIAIVGARSKTVGKYLSIILLHKNATVSLYHSKSVINKKEFHQYDCVISSVGKAEHIKLEHLSNQPQLLIDIGISRINNKIIGDFQYESRDIHTTTPYVKGVGLLTRYYIFENIYNILKESKN